MRSILNRTAPPLLTLVVGIAAVVFLDAIDSSGFALLLPETATIPTRAAAAAGALSIVFVGSWKLGRTLLGPARETTPLHQLSADEKGYVVIESAGVEAIAEHAAMASPGILRADVAVEGCGEAPVKIAIDASVNPALSASEAGTATRRNVTEAVERLAGLAVQTVHVTMHVARGEELSRLMQGRRPRW